MVMCFVHKCNHKSDNYLCKYFRFPKDPVQRKKWTKLIRRNDREPNDNSKICSCHFKDGLRQNGPTIFEWNIGNMFVFPSPENRTMRTNTPNIFNPPSTLDPKAAILPLEEGQNKDDCCEPDPSSSSRSITLQCYKLPASVEAELYFLRQEVKNLTEKLQEVTNKFNLQKVLKDDRKVLMYTGIPTSSILKKVFNLFNEVEPNYVRGWKVDKFTNEEQMFITLMKLKTNSPNLDLAERWNCSESCISNIFMTWLHVLHDMLFRKTMKNVRSQQNNQDCLSSYFSSFTSCQMILDCMEIAREPFQLDKRKSSSNQHIKKNTLKGLVGIAPNGIVTYLSNLYPGSTSEKQVVQASKIMDFYEPGDLILIDEVEETQSVARGRILIEKVIKKIKMFKIVDVIPTSSITLASDIWQVCGALVNFHNPLMKIDGDPVPSSHELTETVQPSNEDLSSASSPGDS